MFKFLINLLDYRELLWLLLVRGKDLDRVLCITDIFVTALYKDRNSATERLHATSAKGNVCADIAGRKLPTRAVDVKLINVPIKMSRACKMCI